MGLGTDTWAFFSHYFGDFPSRAIIGSMNKYLHMYLIFQSDLALRCAYGELRKAGMLNQDGEHKKYYANTS